MNEVVEVLITAEAVNERLDVLAGEIIRDYANKTITLVCALKGAVIFMTDLARRLGTNVEIDFLRTSSYGDSTDSSGNVRLDMDVTIDIHGRDVLLVEDIVDTGHTLVFLRKYLAAKNPASLKVCVLLDKPDRRLNHEAVFDYLGFSIPDVFVVGFGLDYSQRYRNLPYIGVLRFIGE